MENNIPYQTKTYGNQIEWNYLVNHLVFREVQALSNLDLNITNEGDDTILADSAFQGLTTRISKKDKQRRVLV